MLAGIPFGWPAAARSRLASAGSWRKYFAPSPSSGIGDHVEEPGEGLLQRELHAVTIERLDLGDGPEHRDIVAALLGDDVLEGVPDVVRGQLAAVDGRLGVKAHALSELENIARFARLLPGLREISFDGKRSRPDARSRLVSQEPAVRKARHDVRLVGVGEDVIEVRRVPGPQRQGAASLRRLGRRARADGGGDDTARSDRQELSA